MGSLDYSMADLLRQQQLAQLQRQNLMQQGQNNLALIGALGDVGSRLVPAIAGTVDKYQQDQRARAEQEALGAEATDPTLRKLALPVKPDETGLIRDETGKLIGADPDSPNVQRMIANGGEPITERAPTSPAETLAAGFSETPEAAADRIIKAHPSLSALPADDLAGFRSSLAAKIQADREAYRQHVLNNQILLGKEGRENAVAGSTVAKNYSDVGKNEASSKKIAAEAAKIPLDVQSERGQVIAQNLDSNRIAQILKLPADQQDAAFEKMASDTAANLGDGFDPAQVRNQIGAKAYGIADAAQKQQLGNTHFWATLQETKRHNQASEANAIRVADIAAGKADKAKEIPEGVASKIGELAGSIKNIEGAKQELKDWRVKHPHIPVFDAGKSLLEKGANELGTTTDPDRQALMLRIKSIATQSLHSLEGRVDPRSLEIFTKAVNIASDPEQLSNVLDQIKTAAQSEIQGQVSTQMALGHDVKGLAPMSADDFAGSQ